MLALLLTLWIVIASIEKKPSGVEGRSGHAPITSASMDASVHARMDVPSQSSRDSVG